MKICRRSVALRVALLLFLSAGLNRQALGQEVAPTISTAQSDSAAVESQALQPPAVKPSAFKDLFAPLGGDLKRTVTLPNLPLVGIGTAVAFTAHTADKRLSNTLWPDPVGDAFEPGQYVGNSFVQMGGALTTYALGRASGKPEVARVGAMIFRAQMVAEIYTQGLKFTTSRTRPDGTSLSFPSGHSAASFATATVLQSEFGWKVGIPAYAAATWVAASRVEMRRHFLSDVVAGATIGLVAGRSIVFGSGNTRFAVGPMVAPGGVGVSFTKVSRP